jgi:O-antigen/teichoic acid export membrane protein
VKPSAIRRWHVGRSRRLFRFTRDAGLLSAARYSQYVIALVTLPIGARALGVQGTGVWALGTSAYFFGSILVDQGITQLLAAKVALGEASEQLITSYRRRRAWVFACVCAAATVLPLLVESKSVAAISLGFVGGGTTSLGAEWYLIGTRLYGRLAGVQMANRLGYLGLFIWLLPQLPSPITPLALMAISGLFTSVGTVVVARRAMARRGGAGDRGELAPHSRVLFRDGQRIGLAKAMLASYGLANSLLFAPVLSPVVLGLFCSAEKITRAIQSGLESIGLALLPRTAVLLKQRERLRRQWVHVGITSFALGTSIALAIIVCAPLAVHFLLGREFMAAVPYLRIQALTLPFTAVSSTLMNSFMYAKQDSTGILTAAAIGVGVALLCIGLIYVLELRYEVSISVVVIETVVCLFVWRRTRLLLN